MAQTSRPRSSSTTWPVIPTVTALFFAFALSLVLPASAGAQALTKDELIVGRWKNAGLVSTVSLGTGTGYEYAEALFRDSPSIQKQVRYYQELQRASYKQKISWLPIPSSWKDGMISRFKPEPLLVVLDPTRVDAVSYATKKPQFLQSTDANGKSHTRLINMPYFVAAAGTLDELKKGDSWGLETVHHEIGHAIMFPTNGLLRFPHSFTENIIESLKKEGHWKSKVTDRGFAFQEGWAEFQGLYYTGHSDGDYTKLDGRVKTQDEFFRSEGWVCDVLLAIAKDPALNQGEPGRAYRMIHESLMRHKSGDLNGFLVGFVKDYPAARERVEAIVKSESKGVASIEYDRGIGDWFSDKIAGVKKLFGAVKEWWNDRDDTKLRAAPAGEQREPGTVANDPSAAPVPRPSVDAPPVIDTHPGAEKGRALYRRYLDAVERGDRLEAERTFRELRALGVHVN